jgi:type VII secretion integral membrane protein EccD
VDGHPAVGDRGTRPPASEPLDPDNENRARVRDPGSVHNDHTATCAALVAVLLAAAAGWAVLPDAAVPARLLGAAAAAGGAAALGLLAVRRTDPALIGVIVAAVPVGAAACVVLRLPVPAASVAIGVSALALVVGPLLPRAALWLSGTPRPVVPADAAELVAADDGPDLLPTAELVERAELARHYLAGLVGGSALLAGAAALPAAALPGWTGPVFAAVAVTVLGLRARNVVDPAPARALAASALLTGIGLAGVLAWTSAAPVRPVAALGLLLAAATFLAAAGRDRRPLGSPVRRRAVDLVEAVLTAAVVPLALGAVDLYSTLRGR